MHPGPRPCLCLELPARCMCGSCWGARRVSVAARTFGLLSQGRMSMPVSHLLMLPCVCYFSVTCMSICHSLLTCLSVHLVPLHPCPCSFAGPAWTMWLTSMWPYTAHFPFYKSSQECSLLPSLKYSSLLPSLTAFSWFSCRPFQPVSLTHSFPIQLLNVGIPQGSVLLFTLPNTL